MGTLGREPTGSGLGDKEWEITLELGSEKEGGPIPERFSLNNQTTCRVPMSLLAGVCHSGWWNNSMLLGGVSETVLKECAFCYLFIYFCSLFFIKIFFFYFTILYWFCHTLTWICHGRTWVPNPEPPSHHPPHIISLGHPSAPTPSILYPVLNLY